MCLPHQTPLFPLTHTLLKYYFQWALVFKFQTDIVLDYMWVKVTASKEYISRETKMVA